MSREAKGGRWIVTGLQAFPGWPIGLPNAVWVPVAVAGAGAIALARPEVRAGRALASLGRGAVIGAFPA